jgi:MoxR-like ATPase
MFQIMIRYPTAAEEEEIVRRSSVRAAVTITPTLDAASILRVQQLVRAMPVADHVIRYALRLVRATRVKEAPDPGVTRPRLVEDYLAWGAGPRASEYLVLAAKARAMLSGQTSASVEHVRAIAKPVLRHRLMTNFNAEADQVTTDDIVEALLKEVSPEGLSGTDKRLMDSVSR